MDYKESLIQKHIEKPGFKAKIHAKCIECIYDPIDAGTWRLQVQKCTATDCPLYSVRPMVNSDSQYYIARGV